MANKPLQSVLQRRFHKVLYGEGTGISPFRQLRTIMTTMMGGVLIVPRTIHFTYLIGNAGLVSMVMMGQKRGKEHRHHCQADDSESHPSE